jgi:hypothetical protein
MPRADESDAVLAWYIGLRIAILSVESSPNRCQKFKPGELD